jgi:5-(carboxyamino)imidazole ribonucleotide synthase
MHNNKIGIIGGGQLGMLLLRSAIRLPAQVKVYDPDANCSAAHFTDDFTQGEFSDTAKIIEFGKDCDAVIFEIEKVDLKALFELEKMGVRVVSNPHNLAWIQDKGLQKQKFDEAGVPTSAYELVTAAEVQNYNGTFPIVQKWRTGGYDGYGVQIHKTKDSLKGAKPTDSVFEELVDLQKEISVLVARDWQGNIALYPPVEMVFDPALNLVDYLFAPAQVSTETLNQLEEMSREMASTLDFRGIYAIEFFLDNSDKLFVNEISPRPHNSGHHTISANVTSQYEQQLRVALGLPLGSTKMLSPCMMVNLLAENASGKTLYKGIEKAYEIADVQYTFYGKPKVRPGRKMGHAIILEKDLEKALKTRDTIRKTLLITSDEE